MNQEFSIDDIHDILSGMSAHSVVLRALLRANPEVATRIRSFAKDFDNLSSGVNERAARVIQEDLLKLTDRIAE